jgi:transposase
MTPSEFAALFPDDEACLEWLKRLSYPDGTRCPRCGRGSRFHRIRGRTAYSCQYCGGHVYPSAGTLFHKSRVGLRRWFWAVALIGSTRGELSARELERELGVSYKTARRMLAEISDRLGYPTQLPPSPRPVPSRPRWQRARRRA